jgi:hypothetical protein
MLEDAVSNEIGLWLDVHDISPFLYSGFTFEYLSCSGRAAAAIN